VGDELRLPQLPHAGEAAIAVCAPSVGRAASAGIVGQVAEAFPALSLQDPIL
jgi:hypothetical protein